MNKQFGLIVTVLWLRLEVPGSCQSVVVCSKIEAIFFGIVSFFFNYVPEVGTIIAIIIPMPIILLDGRLPSPAMTRETQDVRKVQKREAEENG